MRDGRRRSADEPPDEGAAPNDAPGQAAALTEEPASALDEQSAPGEEHEPAEPAPDPGIPFEVGVVGEQGEWAEEALKAAETDDETDDQTNEEDEAV